MVNHMFHDAGKVHELGGEGFLFIDGIKVMFTKNTNIHWPMFILDQYPYLDPEHIEEVDDDGDSGPTTDKEPTAS